MGQVQHQGPGADTRCARDHRPDRGPAQGHADLERSHYGRQERRQRAQAPRCDRGRGWCLQLDAEVARGSCKPAKAEQYKGVARRYIAEFWDQKPIDAIDEPAITRFWEWRYDYWLKGPGAKIEFIHYERGGVLIRRPITKRQREMPAASTIATESVVLRTFLTYAKRNGLIKEVPDIGIKTGGQANARSLFSSDEIGRLFDLSLERLSAPDLHSATRRDRLVLHCLMCILAYSGMRLVEAKNLNWGDVLGYQATRTKKIRERDIDLRVYGKRKDRTFAPKHAVIPWFDQLWDLFKRDMRRDPQPTDPVFCDRLGVRLGSNKKGFDALLVQAGLKKDYRGKTEHRIRSGISS